MKRIRILIADEHLSVRAQVFARLSREPHFEIVALADTSQQALECALAARPDIILMDPMMSDGLGLAALREISTRLPKIQLVVLSAFCDTAQRIELRKIGVTHILNKGIESHQLVGLLRSIGDAHVVPQFSREELSPNV